MQYINGIWSDFGSHSFDSINPATGKAIWSGKAADRAAVTAGVQAARAAFSSWAGMEYDARLSILERFKSLISGAQDELALLISQETGKALWDAKSEVAAVVSKLGFATEAYQERTGSKSRSAASGTAILTHRPHGVMAVFGPYNFPAHLPNGHIMPALLAGNTVVFKPSEQTPLVAEWMVKRWEAAGLPKGVLNLVQGERETGIELANAAVDGILFTGSSATGNAIHAQLGGRPEILLALEMGGNNPLIVHDVSDIRAAVLETVLSAFISSGQRCTCARRLILPEWPGRDKFLSKLLKVSESLTVGAYDETPAPFMGPVISMREAERLLAAQEKLVNLGAKTLLKMKLNHPALPFLSPGIIDVSETDSVPDEEYFGPFLQIYRCKTLQDAAEIANHTKFGLSAAILCDEPAMYQELSRRLKVGLVNWNRQTTGASGAGPFGGIGASGNHRPAGYYSADYCAYPVASVEAGQLSVPEQIPPGITIG